MSHPIALLAALLAAAATHAVWAAPVAPPAGQPEVRLAAYRIQAGAPRTPLTSVKPGDTIEYEAVYTNHTPHTARGVLLTLPVPAGGAGYVRHDAGENAWQAVASASVDGKQFEPVPLQRAVTLADGRRVMRPVPLAEYRFLRWNLGDLPAGAHRTVVARMQLPALAIPPTAGATR